jgi:pyruvate-ferredoxin/flavodoxin oxidoreductase
MSTPAKAAELPTEGSFVDHNQSKISYQIMDGNEAAAFIAYKCSEMCAINPVAPSSVLRELASEWSSSGIKNVYGGIPRITEVETEGETADTVRAAIQEGAIASAFTESQGLLPMIPAMYKIAGELTPAVFHVSCQSNVLQELTVLGDHSDVMAVRSTGFAMLFGNTAQEVMDLGLIAHASTLKSRIPFLNIYDGFRTGLECSNVKTIPDDVLEQMLDMEALHAFRGRAMNHAASAIQMDTAQSREAASKYYNVVHKLVQESMDQFYQLTGRRYNIYEYYGHNHPDRIIVVMGSAAGAVKETVDYLNQLGRHVGMVVVRLFRPLDVEAFMKVIPRSVVTIGVLDRSKEPSGIGEPLYMNVVNALNEAQENHHAHVMGIRYGLSSREFTPSMAKAVFKEMKKEKPKTHFTIGIGDSGISLNYESSFNLEEIHPFRGLIYSASEDFSAGIQQVISLVSGKGGKYIQSFDVKTVEGPSLVTTTHLRVGDAPVKSGYQIQSANFIACDAAEVLDTINVLKDVTSEAVFLLNTSTGSAGVWDTLPESIQTVITEKKLKFYVIDAAAVASAAGVTNGAAVVMQAAVLALSPLLPKEKAMAGLKSVVASENKMEAGQVQALIDAAVQALSEVDYVEG